MTKQSVSVKQACILILMCIFANKILLLPSLMFEEAKADAFFAIVILFIFDILVLPIFIKLKTLYPEQKLSEILSKKLSPLVTKIIYLIFVVYFIFKCLLVFSITYVYFKQQIYQDEIIWLIIISGLPVINHAIVSGVRAFTRTMEVLKWAVLVGFIACLAFSLFTDLSMPFFFVSTPNEFFTSIYSHIFSFGDYIFLFIIIDKIQIKKGEEKQLYLYSLIGMLLILALFFLFYAKYQVTAFMHNNALADILVFSVQFNAIGRLDIIAMLTIMFITLFQLEIYAYAFCDCFLNVFPKLSKIYSVVVFDVIFGILYYVFIGKYEILVGSSQVWSPWLGLFVNYIFPVICLIIILVTRRKKHERTS